MAPIDPRKNVPISDPRLSSGEDVEGHAFRTVYDADGATDTDVEAHRFIALDTDDVQRDGTGEPPLRSL